MEKKSPHKTRQYMGKAEHPNTTTDKLAHSKDGIIFLPKLVGD